MGGNDWIIGSSPFLHELMCLEALLITAVLLTLPGSGLGCGQLMLLPRNALDQMWVRTPFLFFTAQLDKAVLFK